MQAKSTPHIRPDADTFNEIFRRYRNPLVGYANSYLHDQEDAEDIVQDVFTSIWNKKEEIRLDDHLQNLLFVATKNRCLSLLRSKVHQIKEDRESPDLQARIDLIALEYSTLETIEFEELRKQINRILDSLPEDQRRIFMLHREKGMSYAEIAETAGISVKTVEKKMTATLRIFRHKLKDYDYLLFLSLFITH